MGRECRAYELRHSVWTYTDVPILQHPTYFRKNTFTCIQFPSLMADVDLRSAHSWSLDISEMKIRRFAIDPLVDLLAIIEERENG
jgi:hypothetical protein